MATTSYETAGGLQIPPPGRRVQLAAAYHPVRSDEKPRIWQSAVETVDRANDPVDYEISFGPYRLLPARRLLLEGDRPVSLGSRALDLLIALVERPGEVVSKSELIAKVWPHTFVVEGNLKLHIAALRRALADGQAGNRYISTVPGRGYCFVAPVTRSVGSRSVTAQHLATESLSNLPVPLTRLIGRDEIISRISSQLTHHRLMTLVGPGGIGKTRLAVATADRLANSYEHGVWFVDLTATKDPGLLPAAIISSIRLDIPAEDPSAELLSFLSDKRMLVVLDNCEHLIEAAAAFALEVLRAAPCVQILATSREPLSVGGERLHHVQSLEFPPVLPGLGAAEALEYPAVQLFVDRAASVVGEFEVRDIDVPIVVDICRKLDGIPLAIEFAAASIDALGLQGVASRLDYPLRLPTTRRRSATPRHHTLRSSLDWSYRLLTEGEQRALRRLSVFAGSFTMDAAAAVVADSNYTKSETVDRVVALVAKSLVAADADGSSIRLRLTATTRAYTLEKLAESGELGAIAQRQAGIPQHSLRAAA
jgi:predicted ATPase/DNA-binding winged helix-turn-helix (wHTH) protein